MMNMTTDRKEALERLVKLVKTTNFNEKIQLKNIAKCTTKFSAFIYATKKLFTEIDYKDLSFLGKIKLYVICGWFYFAIFNESYNVQVALNESLTCLLNSYRSRYKSLKEEDERKHKIYKDENGIYNVGAPAPAPSSDDDEDDEW